MMKIGYLHIGPPQHGVCRYGRLLAAEARRQPGLTVIEAEVILTEDREQNQEMLVKAAQQLSEAEIIHFQFHKFNELSWGGGQLQLDYLRIFMSHCSCPLVVTLHNIFYPPYGLTSVFKHLSSKLKPTVSAGEDETNETTKTTETLLTEPPAPKRSTLTKTVQFVQRTFQGTFGPDALALREISKRVALMLVCTEEEARRLSDRVNNRKLKVVPHYVEVRSIDISPAQARAALNLDGVRTVTILGFIYPTKGHQLIIEAMPELPNDITVIFAGGSAPGHEQFVQDCLALAKERGVGDRLRVTGYLSEEELERYLVATDLAVCPFEMTSASGSLSTWISAARPILTSDVPQVAEYNRLEPDAIKIFKPYNPTALAKAIQQILLLSKESDESAVARLRDRLSLPEIFNQHLIHYHNITKTALLTPIISNSSHHIK